MALWPVDHAAQVDTSESKNSTNLPARECDATMSFHVPGREVNGHDRFYLTSQPWDLAGPRSLLMARYQGPNPLPTISGRSCMGHRLAKVPQAKTPTVPTYEGDRATPESHWLPCLCTFVGRVDNIKGVALDVRVPSAQCCESGRESKVQLRLH